MRDKEDKVPLDPNRWSTNKRVKAKTGTPVGTAVKKADGAKTVRPGDPPATSAKTVAASLTQTEEIFRRRVKAITGVADKNEAMKEALTGDVQKDQQKGEIKNFRTLYYSRKFSNERT